MYWSRSIAGICQEHECLSFSVRKRAVRTFVGLAVCFALGQKLLGKLGEGCCVLNNNNSNNNNFR